MTKGQTPFAPVVRFTPKAARRVKEFMEEQGNTSPGVRVGAERDECGCVSYSLSLEEKPAEGDAVFTDNGLKVFVDPATTESVRGATVDYVRTSKGEGFRITGGACGPDCGCS